MSKSASLDVTLRKAALPSTCSLGEAVDTLWGWGNGNITSATVSGDNNVSIDKSNKTNLDTRYIKYQVMASGKYIEPSRLDKSYWNKDEVTDALGVTGNNYILIERILEPQESDEVNVMFWVDYETVPNIMQNKMFYGTLRLYAWQEVETAI